RPELTRTQAEAPDRVGERPVRIKDLKTAVVAVADHDSSIWGDRQAAANREQAVRCSVASELQNQRIGRIENLNAVVAGVGYQNLAVWPSRDAQWALECAVGIRAGNREVECPVVLRRGLRPRHRGDKQYWQHPDE